jgi:hypothetical protein
VIGERLQAVLLLTFVACSPVETAITAQPGVEFAISVGETATLAGTDTRITFKEVREDSRCPIDVTCVWAGDAKIAIIISRSGSAEDTRIISLTPPNNDSRAENFRVRFVGLAPVPRQADHTPRRYIAQLIVEPITAN